MLRYVRIVLVIAGWMGLCVPLQAALSDGLQGYWQGNGNYEDSSANSRDLVSVGGVGFVPGLLDLAYDFSGTGNDYLQRPVNDTVFDFGSGDFTIQFWAKLRSNNVQVFMEKFTGNSGPGWGLYQYGDNRIHFWWESNYPKSMDAVNMADGLWHQVITRRTGVSYEIFYDGVSVGSLTCSTPIIPTTNPLFVGRRNLQGGIPYSVSGSMDEIAIWTRSVSNAEIAYLYNGRAGNPIPEPMTLSLLALGGLAALRKRRA